MKWLISFFIFTSWSMGNPRYNINTGYLDLFQASRFPSSNPQLQKKLRGFRPLLNTIQEEKESKDCPEVSL